MGSTTLTLCREKDSSKETKDELFKKGKGFVSKDADRICSCTKGKPSKAVCELFTLERQTSS